MKKIGVQLYTVRFTLDTEADFRATVSAVKAIGYQSVQLFRRGTPQDTANWCRICMEEGLAVSGILGSLPDCEENAEALFDICATYHVPELGISAAVTVEEEIDPFIARVNAFAEKTAQRGLIFSYHNHGVEFIKTACGKTIMERYIDGFSANVRFMPDTYWIHDGGFDVRHLLDLVKGRVSVLHVKDLVRTQEGHTFAPVGDGNLYFDGILQTALQNGIEEFIVEQDKCDGDPLDCLKRSYAYLTSELEV